jgi:hypothetical protein
MTFLKSIAISKVIKKAGTTKSSVEKNENPGSDNRRPKQNQTQATLRDSQSLGDVFNE